MKKGILFGIGAYTTWGLFPVYWKWLHHVPALQLLCHRIFWSFIILVFLILFLRQWKEFRAALSPRVLRIYTVAALLIGLNWLVYVWAVNAGYILESSLGYFINPLFNVLLGVLLLHERLRNLQWIPIGMAAVGVTYLSIVYGSLPWISLLLAASFALYGFVKKTAPLSSVQGLTLETGILFLPALAYLSFANFSGEGAFLHTGTLADILLVGAGLVTTVPLLMFTSAAQRIPLSLVGILQYISPTLQFILGALVYHEPLTPQRLTGYCIIWAALIFYGVEGVLTHRAQAMAVAAK